MKLKPAFALFLGALVAACAMEPVRPDMPPETRIVIQQAPMTVAAQLLEYLTSLRLLDARAMAAERDIARQQFLQSKSDYNRIRFALVLALAPTVAATSTHVTQDEAELAMLTEPLLTSSAHGIGPVTDPDVRALAVLLHSMGGERRKARELLRDMQARLVLARKEDARDAEIRALKAKVEELESKLNALKSIDRSMSRRTEPVPK